MVDALMMLWNIVFNPQIMHYIEKIESEVVTWPHVSTTIHRFGGLQFNYFGTEIGHIHSNGILDILFSKKLKQTMIQDGLVSEHHIFKHSGWTSFYVNSKSDADKAMLLLELSYKRKLIP
jgi:hypothetical protein